MVLKEERELPLIPVLETWKQQLGGGGQKCSMLIAAGCHFENGCNGNHDANLQWPNIQISSKYINLCVYQIRCLCQK